MLFVEETEKRYMSNRTIYLENTFYISYTYICSVCHVYKQSNENRLVVIVQCELGSGIIAYKNKKNKRCRQKLLKIDLPWKQVVVKSYDGVHQAYCRSERAAISLMTNAFIYSPEKHRKVQNRYDDCVNSSSVEFPRERRKKTKFGM